MLNKISFLYLLIILIGCINQPLVEDTNSSIPVIVASPIPTTPTTDFDESVEEQEFPPCYIHGLGTYQPTIHLKWNNQSNQLLFTDNSHSLYLADIQDNQSYALQKLREDVDEFTWLSVDKAIIFSTYSSSGRELNQISLDTKQNSSILRNPIPFVSLKNSPDLGHIAFELSPNLAILNTQKTPGWEIIVDVLEGGMVDDYSWGPLGLIVYEYTPNPQAKSQIAIINIDTKENEVISDETICARMPTWSPDGQYISFYSDQNGTWDIFMYEVATGQVRAITQNLDIEKNFSWTNTNQFVFLSRSSSNYGAQTEETIYVVDVEGNKQLQFQVPEGGCCLDNFAISPNGQYMAFLYRKDNLWYISLIEMEHNEIITDIFSFPVWGKP